MATAALIVQTLNNPFKIVGLFLGFHILSWARKAYNPATKRLLEYGLIGLVIAAVLISAVQFRPENVFPSSGTLQISLTDGEPSVVLANPASGTCHVDCKIESVNVTITSIEVHTSGINNMTGEWTSVCAKQLPMTIDLIKLSNVTQVLCGAKFQPDTITNVRLSVLRAKAAIEGMGTKDLIVSSSMLEIPLSPGAKVDAGKTTNVTVDFQPHIVIEGNGAWRLTPVLHATSTGPS